MLGGNLACLKMCSLLLSTLDLFLSKQGWFVLMLCCQSTFGCFNENCQFVVTNGGCVLSALLFTLFTIQTSCYFYRAGKKLCGVLESTFC